MKKFLLMSLLLSAAGLFGAAEPTQAGPAPVGQGEGKEEAEEKEAGVRVGKARPPATREEEALVDFLREHGKREREKAKSEGLPESKWSGAAAVGGGDIWGDIGQLVSGYAQPLRWNIEFAPGEMSKVMPEMGEASSVQASANGRYLALNKAEGGVDNFIIWDMQAMREINRFSYSKFVLAKALSSDGKFALYDESKGLILFDAKNGITQIIKIPELTSIKLIDKMNFSPDGNHIIFCAWKENVVATYNLETKDIEDAVMIDDLTQKIGPRNIKGRELSRDGTFFAFTDSKNNVINIYNLQTKNKVYQVNSHPYVFSGYRLLLDIEHNKVVAHVRDRETYAIKVMWWDIRTGEPLGEFGVGEYVKTIAFSPDGNYLVGVDSNDSVTFWNISELEQRYKEQKAEKEIEENA